MPSILSSCLILLKLAMAVNDGLHTMLSNVYSVIEIAMQSDHNRQGNMESIQESNSAPAFRRSNSQILEPFNRRRRNVQIYEQTDVLVSNLTPFQEITITNKDIEGRRKLTVSPIKKSSRKRTRSNKDVESNGETPFPEKSSSLTNSQSLSPSLVSSETENESDYYSSSKDVEDCTQLEGAKNDLSQDNSMDEPINTLEEDAGTQTNFPTRINISASSTSQDSRSSMNKSTITNFGCLKSLQEQIRLISEQMFRASESSFNAKTSLNTICGLTDSDSTNNGEKVSREISSNSVIISPEDAIARKEFLAETTRLSEQSPRKYYARKDACTDLTPKTSPKTKDACSSSSSDSKKSQTFEDNFTPTGITSSNSPLKATSSDEPSMNISCSEQKTKPVTRDSGDSTDSDCTGSGYSSDAKPLSSVSVTKHIDTVVFPSMLKKDSWINMDDEFIKPGSLQKLSETSAWSKTSIPAAHSKECSYDFNNQIKPKDELFPLSHFRTGKDAFEVSQNRPSVITPNLSCRSPSVCEEIDNSDDLEELGLARVDALTKVLQEVGATEILEESDTSQKDILDLLNDISEATLNIIGVSNASETNSASASIHKITNFDVPLIDLDTEEKQINYLNNVTESCLKEIKNVNKSKQENNFTIDDLIGDFDKRYEKVLDSINNAYKNELYSQTQSSGMSLDPLKDTGLRSKYNIPLIEVKGTSKEDNCNTCVSPQQTSEPVKLDAFGLPFFVQNESKAKTTENVLNEDVSSEVESETANDLLVVDKDHSENSFSIGGRQNETSTPIKDQTLESQNWVSINLSSDSRKEFEVTSDDAKSGIGIKTSQNSTFNAKDVIISVIKNGMGGGVVKYGSTLETKDWVDDLGEEMSRNVIKNEMGGGVVWSPNTSIAKSGSTLEAKDWVDLEAEMSKNYLKCISILNMCDDEAEDANMKKESSCNASDEICTEKSDAGKPETLCKSKEDLVERSNCNEALPLIPDETCLGVTKDDNANNKRNMDGSKKRESEMKELNVTCPASNIKDISSAELKYEELSFIYNGLNALRSLDNNALNFGGSIIGNFYLDSEDGNNKHEEDPTELNILSKAENASNAKEFLQNVSSVAVSYPAQIESIKQEELLSGTNRISVQRPLNELQINTNPCKKNILNKEFLVNDFNTEVKCYLKHSERKDKNILTAKEVGLFHPSADYLNRELNFGCQKPNYCRISKQSLAETSSSVLRTPLSNIKALQQREELEANRIYDDEGIYDGKPLIIIPSDWKNNLNAGFKYEAGIQTSKNANEKLACITAKMNNAKISGNDLTVIGDDGPREEFVTKCENRDKSDFDSEILN